MDEVTRQHIEDFLFDRWLEAADRLMLSGAFPVQIDEALVESGFVMGPFEMQDLRGHETAYLKRKAARETGRPFQPNIVSDRMVQEGRLGKISGVGWYRYPGGGGKVEDPLVEDLITEECHFAKMDRREFSNEQIIAEIKKALSDALQAVRVEIPKANSAGVQDVWTTKLGFPAELFSNQFVQ